MFDFCLESGLLLECYLVAVLKYENLQSDLLLREAEEWVSARLFSGNVVSAFELLLRFDCDAHTAKLLVSQFEAKRSVSLILSPYSPTLSSHSSEPPVQIPAEFEVIVNTHGFFFLFLFYFLFAFLFSTNTKTQK